MHPSGRSMDYLNPMMEHKTPYLVCSECRSPVILSSAEPAAAPSSTVLVRRFAAEHIIVHPMSGHLPSSDGSQDSS